MSYRAYVALRQVLYRPRGFGGSICVLQLELNKRQFD